MGTKSCFISTGAADINVGDTLVPKYSKGVYSTNGGGDGSLIFFTPDNKICCLFKNTNVWGEVVYFSDDETIRSDMINDWLTGSSFEECCQKYPGFTPNTAIALENIDDNIESYESGVHQIAAGGPYFHALLLKYTSKYYSGILMCYSRTEIVFFRKYETTYFIKIY